MERIRRIVIAVSMLAFVLGSSPIDTTAQQQEPLLGCVKAGTGLLRILQPGESCKDQETPLGFNDLPLLVALRQQVIALQTTVQTLTTRVEELEARVQALEECTPQQCNP